MKGILGGPTSNSTTEDGWVWPLNSGKAHFFRNEKSLCGRWTLFLGLGLRQGGLTAPASPDDCKECRRRVDAELQRVDL